MRNHEPRTKALGNYIGYFCNPANQGRVEMTLTFLQCVELNIIRVEILKHLQISSDLPEILH